MINIFESVERFFTSVNAYIDYNTIFIIFLSLFIFTILVVIISTSQSYEAKLIKAIDMFNNYFIDNPQITEDNLVQFNNRMKMRKVPKQLRKQWQQFVLYRENKASSYMSFEACVSTPIKNSTYKVVEWLTYFVAYILIGKKIPTFSFGILMSAFCIIYSLISLIIAYKYAPKTFKLRV